MSASKVAEACFDTTPVTLHPERGSARSRTFKMIKTQNHAAQLASLKLDGWGRKNIRYTSLILLLFTDSSECCTQADLIEYTAKWIRFFHWRLGWHPKLGNPAGKVAYLQHFPNHHRQFPNLKPVNIDNLRLSHTHL